MAERKDEDRGQSILHSMSVDTSRSYRLVDEDIKGLYDAFHIHNISNAYQPKKLQLIHCDTIIKYFKNNFTGIKWSSIYHLYHKNQIQHNQSKAIGAMVNRTVNYHHSSHGLERGRERGR